MEPSLSTGWVDGELSWVGHWPSSSAQYLLIKRQRTTSLLLYCIRMSVLFALCICAPHICLVPSEVNSGQQRPWNWSYRWLKSILCVLGIWVLCKNKCCDHQAASPAQGTIFHSSIAAISVIVSHFLRPLSPESYSVPPSFSRSLSLSPRSCLKRGQIILYSYLATSNALRDLISVSWMQSNQINSVPKTLILHLNLTCISRNKMSPS